MDSLHPRCFFDLALPLVGDLFSQVATVWDVLPQIRELVNGLTGGERIVKGNVMPGAFIGDGPVFIGDGAVIEPGAYVGTPAYVGDGAVVRQGAYLRSNVIMLAGSMLGHVSEARTRCSCPPRERRISPMWEIASWPRGQSRCRGQAQ